MRGAPLPFEEAIYAKNKGLWSPFGRCVAYTAGEIDIKAAKQALAKSRNKEVGAFAQQMVRDHTAVNKQALALVKKLKVTPEDNDTSRSLLKQADEKY